MRTTLTLDDDLALALKEAARRRDTSFRVVVNEAIRRGLRVQELQEADRPSFRVRPFTSRLRPGVDPLRLNVTSDELEVDAALEVVRRGATIE